MGYSTKPILGAVCMAFCLFSKTLAIIEWSVEAVTGIILHRVFGY